VKNLHPSFLILLLTIANSAEAHGEEALGWFAGWVAALLLSLLLALLFVKNWKYKCIVFLLSLFSSIISSVLIPPIKYPKYIMDNGWDLFITVFVPTIIVCLISILVIRLHQSKNA
jgi:hypothetical protein